MRRAKQDSGRTDAQKTTPLPSDKLRSISEKSDTWHRDGGALEDARASSNLASLVRGMLEATKKGMPQGHSYTASPPAWTLAGLYFGAS